jgi:hypothetical protein
MANGTWCYKGNHDNPAFQLRVSLANGDMAPIEHLSVDSPSKTLGSMTCSSGSGKGAFIQMREKAQGWIDRVIVGKLNRWHVWFLLDRQHYPMVFFGISSVTAPFDTLSECLQ